MAALVNAECVALGLPPDTTADQVAGWWSGPGLDAERDVLVAELDREVVGYGDLSVQDDEAWLDVVGDPVFPAVLEALEARSVGRATRLRLRLHERDPSRGAVLARGYEVIRASYDMETSLQRPLDEPVWPQGIEVRTAREGEERVFNTVQREAFADHWGWHPLPFDEWLHLYGTLRRYDPELWLLAFDGDDPAGVAICEGGIEGAEDTGWVHVLAVRRPWRNRGLGSALLRWSLQALAAQGLETGALSVDAENTTGAVRLYERAGLRVTQRFETFERAA